MGINSQNLSLKATEPQMFRPLKLVCRSCCLCHLRQENSSHNEIRWESTSWLLYKAFPAFCLVFYFVSSSCGNPQTPPWLVCQVFSQCLFINFSMPISLLKWIRDESPSFMNHSSMTALFCISSIMMKTQKSTHNNSKHLQTLYPVCFHVLWREPGGRWGVGILVKNGSLRLCWK